MVDFIDRIRALASKIPNQISEVKTEEATKTTFVLQFIGALGYDIFNPSEVEPEFIADVGIKKGEKVDYAIKKEGKPIILFECKHHNVNLEHEHASQLYRYFTTATARIAVLTNGIQYRCFTDLVEPNKMDKEHFLELNMLDIKDSDADEIKRLSRDVFELDTIKNAASELQYTKRIKKRLAKEFEDPSDDFVRFFAETVYSGKKINKKVIQEFAGYTSRACRQFIKEQIAELSELLEKKSADKEPKQSDAQTVARLTETGDPKATSKDGRIVTTKEEVEGYNIVKAIVREIVDPKRVVMRDSVHYCGVLLDDNKMKPICKLFFNDTQKFVSIMDAERNEEKFDINDLNDLFQYADPLKKAVARFSDQVIPSETGRSEKV